MKTLVDINLLPRKQARDITTPLVYGICGFFILFVVVLLVIFQHLVSEDVARAERGLENVQALRAAKEEAIRTPQNSSSAQRLENTVQWAEEYPVEMVPVMQELVRMLPDRGFVQSFSYAESGALNVTVQFDQSKDAAYYLYHLNGNGYFQNVNLSSVSTAIVGEEEDADVLPRYIAQYSLEFDKAAIKAEEQETPETEGEETVSDEEDTETGPDTESEDGGEGL
ncbi:type IV pilus assembly protein PilN [Bacillus tianshenii]|uniref:Type IV pilus assembly protein PilN n=1 Tax=Sutcliffiella tianshenii TaxID=1463404 RepID=A0ABS2P1H8_9BACI|nr:PilN domain-containing protein [Bacillus tianshenii]MBM7620458.1 type IV pilus assembly protein PilN [Bacillus tianshenii]